MGLDDISLSGRSARRSRSWRCASSSSRMETTGYGNSIQLDRPWPVPRYLRREDQVAASTTELHLATDGVAHLAVLDGLDVNYLGQGGRRCGAVGSVADRCAYPPPTRSADTSCWRHWTLSRPIPRSTGRRTPPGNPCSRPPAAPIRYTWRSDRPGTVAVWPTTPLSTVSWASPPSRHRLPAPPGPSVISLSVRRQAEFQKAPLLVRRAADRSGTVRSAPDAGRHA